MVGKTQEAHGFPLFKYFVDENEAVEDMHTAQVVEGPF
jgi:hypothetical protein